MSSQKPVKTFVRKEKPALKSRATEQPGPSNVKKEKKEKPIKIVLRRLPMNMTWEDLQIQLEPIPKYSYHRFCAADRRMRPNAFARVYFAFNCRQDAVNFCDRFNGYVFMDKDGFESTGVVELAPNDYIPETQRSDAKESDYKSGTLCNDPDFKNFAAEYEKPQTKKKVDFESLLKGVDEKERQLRDGAIRETPLTEFIIQKTVDRIRRLAEKKRVREEKFGYRGKGREGRIVTATGSKKGSQPQTSAEKKPGDPKQKNTETKAKLTGKEKEKSRIDANPGGNRKERKAAAAAERRDRERKRGENEKKEILKNSTMEREAVVEGDKGANKGKSVQGTIKTEKEPVKPKRVIVFQPAKHKNNTSSPAAMSGSSVSILDSSSTRPPLGSTSSPSTGSSASEKRDRQPPARHVKNKDRPERALYQPGQRRRGGTTPDAP